MLLDSVPEKLSDIVMCMIAKRPAERYQSMPEVIEALEDYLELRQGGQFKEEEADAIALVAERIEKSPWPKIQTATVALFFACCALAIAAALMIPRSPMQKSLSLAAVLTVVLATSLTHLIIRGATYGRPLFARLKQIWLPDGWSGLMNFKFVIPMAMLVLLLYAINIVWLATGLVVLSAGLAIASHFLIDRRAEHIKQEAARQTELVLRDLRSRGIDEQIIRRVVRIESGNRWRGVFESIFGYDAAAMSATVPDADGHVSQLWMDKLIDKANATLQKRWERQKRQLLASLEARWRLSAGVDANDARQEAMEVTDEFARGASVVRAMAQQAAAAAMLALQGTQQGATNSSEAPPQARALPADWTDQPADLLVEFRAADAGKPVTKRKLDYLGALEGYEKASFLRRRFGSPVELLFGAAPRLILAMLVLSGFAAWSIINKGKTPNHFLMASSGDSLKPLRFTYLPVFLGDAQSSFRALGVGVILGLSVFFVGRFYAVLVVIGAMVLLLGPRFYSGPHAEAVVSLLAGGLLLMGILFRRTVE